MGKINDYSLGNSWNSSSAKRVPRLIISSVPRREYYDLPRFYRLKVGAACLTCRQPMVEVRRCHGLPAQGSAASGLVPQCHPLERLHITHGLAF